MKEKIYNKIKEFGSDLFAAITWGVILFIVLAGILWLSSRFHFLQEMPTSESLVITFIGILATFVVVSNFSQVSEVRNKVEDNIQLQQEKINKLASLEDDSSIVKEVINCRDKIKDIVGDEKI